MTSMPLPTEETEIRSYKILDKIAIRLSQYELPGEYLSEKRRAEVFKKYEELYAELENFYTTHIEVMFPEPHV